MHPKPGESRSAEGEADPREAKARRSAQGARAPERDAAVESVAAADPREAKARRSAQGARAPERDAAVDPAAAAAPRARLSEPVETGAGPHPAEGEAPTAEPPASADPRAGDGEPGRTEPAAGAARAAAVLATSGLEELSEEYAARLPRLLEAMNAIGTGPELHSTLDRIVRTAARLVGCRYAAIGVLARGREGLSHFVAQGMTRGEERRLGGRPDGRHGLLPVVPDRDEPLRLADLTAAERSYGFPPGHPPMHSFLGFPVKVRGEHVGNLYLAEKHGGDFTENDILLIKVLATEAGIALRNARLREAARQRERWIEGSVAVTTSLLSGDVDNALAVVAEQARRLADAAAGLVLLPADTPEAPAGAAGDTWPTGSTRPAAGGGTGASRAGDAGAEAGPDGGRAGAARTRTPPAGDPGAAGIRTTPVGEPGEAGPRTALEIVAASTDDPSGRLIGTVIPPDSPALAPLLSGEPVVVDDSAHDPRMVTGIARHFGPALLLPLQSGGGVMGTLAALRAPGAEPFTETEKTLAAQFAAQAALALVLADAQRDRERLAVYEDRDRIARDLHDLVIQRLFAVGMTLQGAYRQAPDPAAAARGIRLALDELDATIGEIRTAIFALQQGPGEVRAGLRTRVLREIGLAAVPLGFQPAARFVGPVDSRVGEPTTKDLVAALREALSNAFRHAQATRIEVTVDVTARLRDGSEGVRLTVADDGVGIPAEGRRSGLANIARRAENLGGSASWTTGEGGGPGGESAGTTLTWQARL